MNLENRITIIELCAGIGMTSLGIKRACRKLGIDVTIKAFSEIDKHAIEGYKKLHGEDITNIGDVTLASFVGEECTFLLFTSPCTNLSKAGNRKGMEKDSNTASSIIWELTRILDEMKELPSIIFIENVPELIGKKNWSVFEQLVKEVEAKGYHTYYQLLNSKNYNVPQNRERLFLIFSLKELPFSFPKKEPLTNTLPKLLEVNPDKEYYIKDMTTKVEKCINRGYAYRVLNPTAKCAYTITTRAGYRNDDNYLFDEAVSDDAVVRFNKTNYEEKNLRPLTYLPIRKLTRLELGRLMGLTDDEIHILDFIPWTPYIKIMGNGIVVPVVEKIFINLLKEVVD